MKKADSILNRDYCSLFLINVFLSLGTFMVNTTISRYVVGIGIAVGVAGTIVGVMSIAAMLVRPFSGWISDRFDRKRLLLVFMLLIGVSLLGYAFAQSTISFMLLRIVQGISFGMITTITMSMVAAYIPEGRTGEGMGYFALGQSIAVAVGPGIGLATANAFGNAATFYLAAGLILAGIVCVLLLRPDVDRGPMTPGLHFRDFFAPEALGFAVIACVIGMVNGIETGFIALYADSLGISNIGWYFTVSAVVLFLGRVFLGRITDRKGVKWAVYPGCVAIVFAMLLLSAAGRLRMTALFGVAAALKAAGVGLIQPAIQAACIRTVEASRRGAASSTYYIGMDIGQGAAPVLAGNLVQSVGFSAMFGLFSVPVAMVLLTFGFLNKQERRST